MLFEVETAEMKTYINSIMKKDISEETKFLIDLAIKDKFIMGILSDRFNPKTNKVEEIVKNWELTKEILLNNYKNVYSKLNTFKFDNVDKEYIDKILKEYNLKYMELMFQNFKLPFQKQTNEYIEEKRSSNDLGLN